MFVPTAQDSNGDRLTFTIQNRPSWLTFNGTTGALTGTPTEANVGTYSGVTIRVSDGERTTTLPSFSIQVVSLGTKSVTLTWQPPTQNDDGTPLRDLAGYKIRYGQAARTYTKEITLNTPGLATYVVDGLVPSTYYFVITAFNSKGVESSHSNEATVTR